MSDVRSMLGVPVAADFASTTGTPVIVNQTTGFAYVLKADGSVYQVGAFTGTVSSVASNFTGGLISVSGSPVTTSGTLAGVAITNIAVSTKSFIGVAVYMS